MITIGERVRRGIYLRGQRIEFSCRRCQHASVSTRPLQVRLLIQVRDTATPGRFWFSGRSLHWPTKMLANWSNSVGTWSRGDPATSVPTSWQSTYALSPRRLAQLAVDEYVNSGVSISWQSTYACIPASQLVGSRRRAGVRLTGWRSWSRGSRSCSEGGTRVSRLGRRRRHRPHGRLHRTADARRPRQTAPTDRHYR